MVRLVGVMARCQGQRKSSEFRRYLVLARVDSGAVGEVEVGARAGGERGLDAADGLDDGAELERADARGRQQRREDHVVPRRDADDVVGARVLAQQDERTKRPARSDPPRGGPSACCHVRTHRPVHRRCSPQLDSPLVADSPRTNELDYSTLMPFPELVTWLRCTTVRLKQSYVHASPPAAEIMLPVRPSTVCSLQKKPACGHAMRYSDLQPGRQFPLQESYREHVAFL
jgi:hypothetical protein